MSDRASRLILYEKRALPPGSSCMRQDCGLTFRMRVFMLRAIPGPSMQSLQARSSRIASSQFVILAREFVGYLVAVNAAFLLRFDFAIPSNYMPHLWFACLAMPLLKVLVFKVMGLERCWWRYFSLEDLERLLFGNFAASLLCGVVIWGLGPAGFPRSIYILDLVLATAVSAGGRATMRRFGELSRQAPGTIPKRVLIYGAGSAGVILLREIRQN